MTVNGGGVSRSEFLRKKENIYIYKESDGTVTPGTDKKPGFDLFSVPK